MKKIISFMISLMILVGIPKASYANTTNDNKIFVDAGYAIALDAKTKRVLYGKDHLELIPMASTTKIITALVAIKYGDIDKKVKISKEAAYIDGSTVGYREGEEISIRELLYGLMFKSGNDAAIAIAEGIGGSVDGFMVLMNEFAKEMGLLNTHFETPHGLDRDKDYHYTTAYDLAVATAIAKENHVFSEIVKTKSADAGTYGFSRSYNNINKFLHMLPEATGVKTGFTCKAGKCLVSSAVYDGREVIMVVLNSNPRWGESLKMFNYVRENYQYKTIVPKGEKIEGITIDEEIKVPIYNGNEYEYKLKGKYLNIYENTELIYRKLLK